MFLANHQQDIRYLLKEILNYYPQHISLNITDPHTHTKQNKDFLAEGISPAIGSL
jgi:hypothetical protein